MTDIALSHADAPDLRTVSGSPRTVRNVTRPVLTPFAVAEGGPAVIICPGGAFHLLSLDNEGHELAKLLAAAGITSYVLEYRLIETPVDDLDFAVAMAPFVNDLGNPVELRARIEEHRPVFRADGLAALAWVRERHTTVAMVGFSAGGILVADLLGLDDPAATPDLAALVYTPFSTPAQAPASAPPLFVLAASDDPFGVAGSHDVAAAWTRAGAPVDLHLFAQGGHGFGTTALGLPVDAWPELLLSWLGSHGVPAR